MPTPDRYTKLAHRYYHLRWRFLAVSLSAFAGVFGIAALASSPTWPLPVSAAGLMALGTPLIFGAWGLLCMCVWFHPTRGNLRADSRWVSWLPSWARALLRWHAALTLSLFLVVSLLMPVLYLLV
jgi:hypothetical protein